MSECVLKTLACRGFRIGPSKATPISEWGVNKKKISSGPLIGFEKRGPWKWGLIRKVHFLEILESPRLWKKGESDHFREKKAHKHKLFALVNDQMGLGQTAGCPRVHQAKKFMCSPRNTGNKNVPLWSTSGLSQGCPDFQKVYVFSVYVPFSCPTCSRGSR